MRKFKLGFTLAEVLITLAIIGVVAALTIPTLWDKINNKLSENRQTTIEARLLDGINRYSSMEDGLSQPYNTTYDFLVGLSKFYKMAQICKADEITKCVPYDVINYDDNGTPASIEVKTLQKIDSFMSTGKENYLEPASFITAQGTPVIMAFKKDCAWDMGKAMRSIQDSGCIAYMYDESGTRLPNKFGVDIIPHGLTITGKGVGTPIATVGGVKIMEKAFFARTLNASDYNCSEEASKNYGITGCFNDGTQDYWGQAMKYCHDKGWRLPNNAESIAIVNGLFKDISGNHPSGNSWNSSTYILDLDLAVTTLGLRQPNGSSLTQANVDGGVDLWSSEQIELPRVFMCVFGNRYVSCSGTGRWSTFGQGLCISD